MAKRKKRYRPLTDHYKRVQDTTKPLDRIGRKKKSKRPKRKRRKRK